MRGRAGLYPDLEFEWRIELEDKTSIPANLVTHIPATHNGPAQLPPLLTAQ